MRNQQTMICLGSARKSCYRRRGSIVVLTAFLMTALLAAVAFSVDVSYMQLVRVELRASTELAARAGAENILRTRDEFQARAIAKEMARTNRVAGKPLELRDEEIVFGRVVSTPDGRSTFQPGLRPYNTVQVNGERTAKSLSGAVPLFFGPIFGVKQFEPVMISVVTYAAPQRDLAIVVDRSGSMLEFAGRQSKWDALLTSFDELLVGLEQTTDEEQIGLASYSGASTIDANLTTAYPSVRTALHRKFPSGFTNITAGIRDGLTILSNGRPDARKLLVVMTDGLHNVGPGPASMIPEIVSADVDVIAISFGNQADQVGMARIAAAAGGRHFHANNGSDLSKIFEEVSISGAGLQYFQ